MMDCFPGNGYNEEQNSKNKRSLSRLKRPLPFMGQAARVAEKGEDPRAPGDARFLPRFSDIFLVFFSCFFFFPFLFLHCTFLPLPGLAPGCPFIGLLNLALKCLGQGGEEVLDAGVSLVVHSCGGVEVDE